MSASVLIVVGVVCLAIGLAGGYWLPPHGRRPGKDRPKPVKRILLPFTGSSISAACVRGGRPPGDRRERDDRPGIPGSRVAGSADRIGGARAMLGRDAAA